MADIKYKTQRELHGALHEEHKKVVNVLSEQQLRAASYQRNQGAVPSNLKNKIDINLNKLDEIGEKIKNIKQNPGDQIGGQRDPFPKSERWGDTLKRWQKQNN